MNYPLKDLDVICDGCCCYVGVMYHLEEDCDRFRREWAEDLGNPETQAQDIWRSLQKNMTLTHPNWFPA